MTEERNPKPFRRSYGVNGIWLSAGVWTLAAGIAVFQKPDAVVVSLAVASVHVLAALVIQEIYRLQDLIGGENDHD